MGRSSRPVLGFILLCCLIVAGEAEYLKYKDPKMPVGARIKDLMKRMTIEEKIGQMVQIERTVASPDVMKQYFIGSVLSGGGSVPAPKASAEAWVNMVNEIQKASLSTRLGIPMIYGIDAVHGHSNVYNATIFPHNVGLGVTRDPQLLKKIGEATALEVRATGIPYAFAPCIAVCRDPRWGRCYESYSEDHRIVQLMTEIIPGLQGEIPSNSKKGVPFVAPGNFEVSKSFFEDKKMSRISIPLVGFLLLLCCLGIPMIQAEGDYIKYRDPKQTTNVRIRDLMSRMTLAEKIGQMAQIERSVATADILRDCSIGSILSGGGSAPLFNAKAKDWIDMINGFQNASLSSRLGIPMIYGIDAVHGHNNVYKATIFPHNVGLGATRDPDLVKRIGAATALEVRATGIPYVFAPCIAVCRDPRWGRCYESYSEDPKVVEMMTEIIPGLQGDVPSDSRKGVPYVGGKDKVAACAKHFVGDGGTTKGINENDTVIGYHGLMSIHMPAYFPSIIKGVSTVMVSYSSWNGQKMHANRYLVKTVLKDILKFRGFVISDWEGIDRITYPPHSNYTESVLKGISAGIDMIMVPYNHTEFINIVTDLVNKNYISMDRIDDAVRRILRVKFALGLFETPLADETLVDQLGSQAHRDLAREAVRKSLVLLKNGGNADAPVLPLPKKASKILVAGSHANNLGYQCGGWTATWQGVDGNNYTAGTTILSGITAAVDPSTEIVYSKNPDADFVKSNNFSYAIVVVGETPYAETAGDSLNLTIAEPGPSTILNVCGNVKCVVVIVSGRPVVIEPYESQIDALVAAWLPGTEGQGVADVLFGDYGFTGKLPRTWFRTVDQLPMNVGDSHYDPLFPYDFGLTTKPVNAS